MGLTLYYDHPRIWKAKYGSAIWDPLSRLISAHCVIARKDLNIRKRRGGSWKIGFFYHVKCQDRISKQIIEKKLLPFFGADRFWSWFSLCPEILTFMYIYSHLSNKRDITLTDFGKFQPAQNKNPPCTFIDFITDISIFLEKPMMIFLMVILSFKSLF